MGHALLSANDPALVPLSGTLRAIIANMVQGVSRRLPAQAGAGRRRLPCLNAGQDLTLALGFSHPVLFKAPEGITITTPTQTEILVSGADKQRVGEVAAKIRGFRPPEPYKGKGVSTPARRSSARKPRRRNPARESMRFQLSEKQTCSRKLPAFAVPSPPARTSGTSGFPASRYCAPASIFTRSCSAPMVQGPRCGSTTQADVREGLKNGKNADAAVKVGRAIAEKAIAAGVEKVAFDRSGYRYHGRIKALADAAREGAAEVLTD